MVDWFRKILKQEEEKETLQWETEESILKFIQENVAVDGTLDSSAQDLPDHKKSENDLKFAPGLMDAMFGEDDSEQSKSRVKRLSTLITRIAKKGDNRSKAEFYQEITENEGVIGIIDNFLEELAGNALPLEPYLFDFACKLATKTNNRNAVKFGIAILGLCRNQKPLKDIKTLGLHDEFTVFSTVAILNLSSTIINDLWELAQKVDGWGKIQLVERLAPMDLNDEIRDWLVLEGYKNSIMYEYLALTCATNGKLNQKLNTETISDTLFTAASEIIIALLDEGPVAGISEYQDAEETIKNFIRHSQSRNLTVQDYVTLDRIKEYLETATDDNDVAKSWDQNELSNSIIDVHTLLNSKDWTNDLEVALKSTGNLEYWSGRQVAKKIGFDLWDTVWNKVRQNPFDSTAWYEVTEMADENNLQDIIEVAISNFPLELLGSGPKESYGFGEDYEKHTSLESVITFLENYPAKGEKLVLVGLDSPVTRVRNMTIRTLHNWKEENWSDEVKTKVQHLVKVEPNKDTRDNIKRLLNGEELK